MISFAPTNKRRMYEMYLAGEFGNRLRAYDNLADYNRDAEDLGRVAMRFTGPARRMIKNLDRAQVNLQFVQGVNIISEFAPDQRLTLHGEVMRDHRGLVLYYSTVRGYRMRDGLSAFGQTLTGLSAKMMLQRHLDSASYLWLEELMQRWPGCIVEFSSYDMLVGDRMNNTLWWEVRLDY